MRRYFRSLLLPICALAVFCIASNAGAAHIATIDGEYNNPASPFYDTPSLIFRNTSVYDFNSAVLTLTPYQPGTVNFGIAPQSRSFGPILAGTTQNFFWLDGAPSVVVGNLFSYDYDDATVFGTQVKAVGNFSVTFTAIANNPTNPLDPNNGKPIFSVFSPTTNATGGFVGWEGLDPNGVNENFVYDNHNGTTNGTMALTLASRLPNQPPSPCLASASPAWPATAGVERNNWRKSDTFAEEIVRPEDHFLRPFMLVGYEMVSCLERIAKQFSCRGCVWRAPLATKLTTNDKIISYLMTMTCETLSRRFSCNPPLARK
jgi:hypothetical protein